MSTTLERLTVYRSRLKAARTFKEYRAEHLAWIDLLIVDALTEETKASAMKKWVAAAERRWREPRVKVEVKK